MATDLVDKSAPKPAASCRKDEWMEGLGQARCKGPRFAPAFVVPPGEVGVMQKKIAGSTPLLRNPKTVVSDPLTAAVPSQGSLQQRPPQVAAKKGAAGNAVASFRAVRH